MTGAVKSRTARLSLARLWFNFPNWGDDANQNMDLLDAAFAAVGITISGGWANNTAYINGQIIVDVPDNSIWRCAIPHTSALTGTFLADRALHPTYWTALNNPISARGAWATATQYYPNDIVQSGTQYAICVTAHISSVYATDLAAGKWAVISDAVGGQPADATLTALAALNATAGMVVQTAADTFTKRTLIGTTNEIGVTNGDGVAGNPTVSLPATITLTGKTLTGGTFTTPTLNTPIVNTPTISAPTITGTPITPFNMMNCGRLTLFTGIPVTYVDILAATTLYFTPYLGNIISLYNGTAWVNRTFAEISLSLAGITAALPYDVFVYDNAGVATLELTAWNSSTVRATALVLQDGVWVKTGATTRRYVGTICASAANQCEDSQKKRYLWNMYNRVRRACSNATETVDSWTYSTATWRQARGNAANQLDFVRGLDEDCVEAIAASQASNGTVAELIRTAIGLDSTTAFSVDCLPALHRVASANHIETLVSRYFGLPGIGRHVLTWLEQGDGTVTTTWFGDAGVPLQVQTGIQGSLMA